MGDISLCDVVFAEATPSQRRLTWQHNGAVWAPPLSVEDYVAREATLSETALSRDGGSRYWVLHRRGAPEDIVSSCETTRKTALVRGGGGGAGEGVREVVCYSVASVHTHPRYRARGMAALLMKRVQEVMDGVLGAECSVLYSDTGKVYYAQMGWEVFPSQQATIYVEGGTGLEVPPGVRFLAKEEVPALCRRDAEAVRERLEMLPADGRTSFVMEPSFEQCSWHFAREEFMVRALAGKVIERRGAVTRAGDAWMYWDHDFKRGKLRIQRIVALGPDPVADICELLSAAMVEAQSWEFMRVKVWNPTEDVTLGAKAMGNKLEGKVKLIFDERWQKAIPSLRWRKGRNLGEVIWRENEYYAWC